MNNHQIVTVIEFDEVITEEGNLAALELLLQLDAVTGHIAASKFFYRPVTVHDAIALATDPCPLNTCTEAIVDNGHLQDERAWASSSVPSFRLGLTPDEADLVENLIGVIGISWNEPQDLDAAEHTLCWLMVDHGRLISELGAPYLFDSAAP